MTEQFEQAFRNYRNGSANAGERAMVEAWYAQWHTEDRVTLSEEDLNRAEELMHGAVMAGIRTRVRQLYLWRSMAAAAAVVVVGLMAYWYWSMQQQRQKPAARISQVTDVPAPAGTRATVTLNNGKVVYLDSAASGALATQGSVLVSKTAEGKIVYKSGSGTAPIAFNTLSNPRGSRVIDLVLGDGTHVWLNSASTLTYPVAFTGHDRAVTVTGEAYFEVAHNSGMPFRVNAGGVTIEDIGTAFDVNTYPDEPYKSTTLVEGSVRVSTPEEAQVLHPGEQVDIGQNTFVVGKVDVEKVIAWKNGYFAFGNADLATVMRQVARWYDVDVEFRGNLTGRTFSGELGRSLTLSQLLTLLGKERIKYKIIDPHKLLIIE